MNLLLSRAAFIASITLTALTAFAQKGNDNGVPTLVRIDDYQIGDPDLEAPIGDPEITGRDGEAEGERNIFWLHGLNGRRSAWQPVAADIASRYEVEYLLPEYADLQNVRDLDHVTSAVRTLLPSPSAQRAADPEVDPSETIYIGHSLGGIVGRRMTRYHHDTLRYGRESFPYGMIATVASPHQGSRIAGAREELTEFLSEGCAAITKGPLLDVVSDIPKIPQIRLGVGSPIPFVGPVVLAETSRFDAIEKVEEFIDTGCVSRVFTELIDALAVDKFLPAVAEEISLNSPALEALNSSRDPFDLPKANIVATEDHPVALRLWGSALAKPESNTVYAADEDRQVMQIVAQERADYELAELALNNEASYVSGVHQHYEINEDGGIDVKDWSPIRFAKHDKARRKRLAANGYREGITFYNELNGKWLIIQGARELEVIGETYHCECTEYDYGDVVDTFSVDLSSAQECRDYDNDDQNLSCQLGFVIERTRAVDIPTDGAATEESQLNWVDHSTGELVPEWFARGSNHLQIRNDSNTDEALNQRLFNGRLGSEFKLEPRQ